MVGIGMLLSRERQGQDYSFTDSTLYDSIVKYEPHSFSQYIKKQHSTTTMRIWCRQKQPVVVVVALLILFSLLFVSFPFLSFSLNPNKLQIQTERKKEE
jgi:hypothetical protein